MYSSIIYVRRLGLKRVGAYEAKTHLPSLIDRVLKGEVIQITRHGVPVANLVPVDASQDRRDVLDHLRDFRAQHRLNGVSIRELINEGRRR